MSSLAEENLTIYIKHEEGRNEKPILCNRDATVHDLAEAVKKNADTFLDAFDGVCANKVDLEIYRLENGKKVVLKPREKIEQYVDTELLFNIGYCLYLERVDKTIQTKSFKLYYNTQTLDLVNQISKGDQDLGLSCQEKESVEQHEKLIKVYKKEQQVDGLNIPLESNKTLMEFHERTLVYELVDPKDYSTITSINDCIKVCNGQNIVLFGEPGHGKSATLNSLVRVTRGVHTQIVQTAGGSAKGTVACTPTKFEFSSDTGNAYFTVWDVPGLTKKSHGDDSNLKEIICNILDGNFTEERWLNMELPKPKSPQHNQDKKIHAVVCVVNGTAPELSSLPPFVRTICTHEGCNTPFFVVVTHADKFGEAGKKKEDITDSIATETGTDKSCIFTIANRDHLSKDTQWGDVDFTLEREIVRMLKTVLGAAYNDKNMKIMAAAVQKEEGGCSVL
ncbi:uncharacterized protein [Ptychodera flava]|uniref:uncharacterized protein n=1 Tax=Ptychodera flava TaxID=63121 RepID=UPI003969BBFB